MSQTYTIGELARQSGVSTRKIRFYADAGLLSPGRTQAQYRLFSDRDLVVLDLIGALRAAGASLEAIRSVLGQDASLAELLAVRLADVEASIQRQKSLAATLRLALANGSPTLPDFRRVSQMIRHSQAQRYATATSILNAITGSIHFDPRWREAIIKLISAPSLPDEPSAHQVDAWLELNELLASEHLQRILRAQAIDTGRSLDFLRVRDDLEGWQARENEIMDKARLALRKSLPIDSDAGQRLADEYIAFMAWNRGVPDDAAFRSSIGDVWSDNDCLDRFWHCVGILNGHENTTSGEYKWLASATAFRLQNTR
jgi:DNA-binding transcriptional MerR regulator